MRYNIENISKEQLSLIERSVDLYMRLLCGQINQLDNFFLFQTDYDSTEMKNILKQFKKIIFPDQSYMEYIGIFSHYCNPTAREGYDIYQQIRKVRDEGYHVVLENDANKFTIIERSDENDG